MEVYLTSGSQMIYVIPEIMMTIGDFYRNIQISILTRGYEAWQNSEANLLIIRGLVGTTDEYYEEYGDIDDYIEKGKQIIDQDERYSSTPEPHILVNKISQHATLPQRQTEGSAGLDISASHVAIIEPYGRDLVHTGLRIEIPYDYYGQLASHSGLAWKNGIEVGAGVIDSDYRGEVKVLLFNRTNILVYISPQQKIAQLIPEKITLPEVYEVPHLSYFERGDKGFGSTDKPNTIPESAQDKASTSQQPRHFTANDIFSLLMPRETAVVLVQDDSIQNNSEQDQAATTSPWASVPRFLDPTPNYEDIDDSYLDYIAYLDPFQLLTNQFGMIILNQTLNG
ncbi:hypothetical protein ZIOFF_018620 [Zingiber officinale]|uniref:Deoxyuridine 5'-triphosphate nucleotidohydrolase n=1 Tax=Zingiber officinale TaxID=94328 RepID=A0A8J5H6K3_ZINOF|nr:hypothetical protein ZIOFF_018620 [Zingiber officinale]